MMNRDSVYSRRRAFMNRTCSGYLRMSMGGSRDNMEEDVDDASSDAGSIRSTASTRSWRKTRNRKNRRNRPPLERAQSLFGDATADHMNFNLNRPNIDPFSFGLRRNQNTTSSDAGNFANDQNHFRNRNLESSSSVDSDNLRQDALERDADFDVHNELSTIAQSPEAYYSSSSLDTSSDDDETNTEEVVDTYARSRDHKDTHDWLMTGSFGSKKELPKEEKPLVPRLKIVEKSKVSNPRALGIHQGLVGSGLNDLATIINDEPSPSMDESTLKNSTLSIGESPITEIVARRGEKTRESETEMKEGVTREAWEKGNSALERMRDDGEESFGVFCADQFSHLAEDAKVASSTPSDTKPPSLNESAILRPLMSTGDPEHAPGGLPPWDQSSSDPSSSSDVRLYSINDLSQDFEARNQKTDIESPVNVAKKIDPVVKLRDRDMGVVMDTDAADEESRSCADQAKEKTHELDNVSNGLDTPPGCSIPDCDTTCQEASGANEVNKISSTYDDGSERVNLITNSAKHPVENDVAPIKSPASTYEETSPKADSPRNKLKPNLDSKIFSSSPERKSPDHTTPPTTSPRHSFRHTTLEVVIEEEPHAVEGDASNEGSKKKQNAFAENLAELNMDVSEESFFEDEMNARCLATVTEELEAAAVDDDTALDDVEEMLIMEDEKSSLNGKVHNIDGTLTDQNNSTLTSSAINETDGLQEQKVIDNAPSGANVRRKRSLPITTSDKSGLCSCCLVM